MLHFKISNSNKLYREKTVDLGLRVKQNVKVHSKCRMLYVLFAAQAANNVTNYIHVLLISIQWQFSVPRASPEVESDQKHWQ